MRGAVNASTRRNFPAEAETAPPTSDKPSMFLDILADDIPPTAVLARDVRSRGQVILAAGSTLTPRYVTLLKNLLELHPDIQKIEVEV